MRSRPSDARAGKEARSEPEPVRILTRDLLLDGSVASSGQRITDILLRGEALPFLPAGADPAPDNWILITAQHVLAVIPPPLQSRSVTQTQPTLRPALAVTGPYRITGTAHLRSEDKLDEAFRRRQPFLPLTGATISRPDGHSEEVAVVIVNLDNCQAFGLT